MHFTLPVNASLGNWTQNPRVAHLTQEYTFMRNLATRVLKDKSGATAIEYGLIAAFVGVVLVAALQFLGTQLTSTFSNVGNKLKSANGG